MDIETAPRGRTGHGHAGRSGDVGPAADRLWDRPGVAAATVATMAVLVALTIGGELGGGLPRWLLALDVIMGLLGCLAMPVVQLGLDNRTQIALLGHRRPRLSSERCGTTRRKWTAPVPRRIDSVSRMSSAARIV